MDQATKDQSIKTNTKTDEEGEMPSLIELLRAPSHLGMKVLDRAAFTKRIPTYAAVIKDRRDIQRVRNLMRPVALRDPLGRTNTEDVYGPKKNPLFQPLSPYLKINKWDLDGQWVSRMPSELLKMVDEGKIEIIEKEGELTYSAFNSEEILRSVLPTDDMDGIHHSFSAAGHIAHMNLRDEYLPYKHLMAEVIMDKNPNIQTVVNKIEDVGSHSVFRTFPMEFLAGKEKTQVSLRSSECAFDFDFKKVYWNSRLENEHNRVVALCRPGEAVCDVMAGVGPFAIPAAKWRSALVWANDLNPMSFDAMYKNIRTNKVRSICQPFNIDGRKFIQAATKTLFREGGRVIEYDENVSKAFKLQPSPKDPMKLIQTRVKPPMLLTVPKVFNRFIMNLPDSAVEFLDAFIGIYRGHETSFINPNKEVTLGPNAEGKEKYPMPIIHLYIFSPGKEYDVAAEDICQRISAVLQYPMTVGKAENLREGYKGLKELLRDNGESKERETLEEGKVNVGYVRLVAPQKSMYCATFVLPRDVAFAEPQIEEAPSLSELVWKRSDVDAEWPQGKDAPKGRRDGEE